MSSVIAHPTLASLLRDEALTCAYQPIVDLDDGRVVAYEALVRGPAGTELARPDQLFAAAEREGLVVELDWACRAAAARGALAAGLDRSTHLFVNVEPRALRAPVPERFVAELAEATRRLRLVVEVTERALVHDPAAMVAALRAMRAAGLGIALDDVGADPGSLALLPFVEPDVIKLDLRLVHDRTDAEIAAIAAAVRADAERRGAVILAEGIETPLHRRRAEVLGATYGQGWLFGRPGPLPADGPLAGRASLPAASRPAMVPDSPWSLVQGSPACRTTTKSLLMPMSHHLEQQARSGDAHGVVIGAFQDAVHFTPATAARYAALADRCALVGAVGRSLDRAPASVRTGPLPDGDPLADEWTVAVVTPHYAGALIARERDDGAAGADGDRRFDYVITHDRDTVVAATRSLLRRLAPR